MKTGQRGQRTRTPLPPADSQPSHDSTQSSVDRPPHQARKYDTRERRPPTCETRRFASQRSDLSVFVRQRLVRLTTDQNNFVAASDSSDADRLIQSVCMAANDSSDLRKHDLVRSTLSIVAFSRCHEVDDKPPI